MAHKKVMIFHSFYSQFALKLHIFLTLLQHMPGKNWNWRKSRRLYMLKFCTDICKSHFSIYRKEHENLNCSLDANYWLIPKQGIFILACHLLPHVVNTIREFSRGSTETKGKKDILKLKLQSHLTTFGSKNFCIVQV